MNRVFLFLFLCLLTPLVRAQYSSQNSFMRKAITAYYMNSKGFYEKRTDVMMNIVDGIERVYAYDKKAHNLYLITDRSNVVVTLNKEYAKIVKKNKSIPQLRNDDLEKEIVRQSSLLDEKFSLLNKERELHIKDSIEQAIADSIEKVRRYEKMIAEQENQKKIYRGKHKYYYVPTSGIPLYCDICDKSFTEDSVLTIGISNDTIYFLTAEKGALNLPYTESHMANIPLSMAFDEKYKYHYEIFKDSLTNDSLNYRLLSAYMASDQYNDYMQALRREAPYGYVDGWEWNNEYSMLTFNFRFVNTNPKTIKYITVYFKITNDVGDVRKTGYFQGTGPLAEGESASWDWDSSSYFLSGDATRMSITKIVLTYMNGSRQTLSGKILRFN